LFVVFSHLHCYNEIYFHYNNNFKHKVWGRVFSASRKLACKCTVAVTQKIIRLVVMHEMSFNIYFYFWFKLHLHSSRYHAIVNFVCCFVVSINCFSLYVYRFIKHSGVTRSFLTSPSSASFNSRPLTDSSSPRMRCVSSISRTSSTRFSAFSPGGSFFFSRGATYVL